MGMTMTQKILARHAGLSEVKAGQLIEASLDLVLGNDITTPVAIEVMKGFKKSRGKGTRRSQSRSCRDVRHGTYLKRTVVGNVKLLHCRPEDGMPGIRHRGDPFQQEDAVAAGAAGRQDRAAFAPADAGS